ncbi:GLPGLI family protein [Bizionia argentinensis JUB59]|uniref:GLPGLI family protein n=1 Tax=Bizionia argentinensis JUB59 TaxID=1046627 RepID=G2EEY1_9FLAO|nr:GLPGLI family protein [Bizionia argentinensis]EGV43071.2 GLPGLI family protein [Bizionia argentinensis JUB59]
MRNLVYYVFILFVYFNSSFSFAQSNYFSGTVTYSVSLEPFYNQMEERYKNESNKTALQYLTPIVKTASNFTCNLIYKGQQSKFSVDNGMALGDNERLALLAQAMIAKGIYYTNLITGKQMLHVNRTKNTFVESDLNTFEWQLTKDMKKIGDYVCYKAIAYQELENIGEVKITVWYTPQIPIAFGPKEYVGNLPGLVLEYEDNVVHFTASKIVLNPKEVITINWPKGKTISKEDYQKQNSDSFSTLKENSGR